MNLKEFGECIEFNLVHGLRHAVLGLGAPGLGKSQIIRQIGEKHGYKVIDLRLAQMSEVEIGGLIYPNEDRTKTRWLSPEVLPDVERDGEKTILLLDEITSCPKRVQVAAYQLILDRRVGQYTLPEGTFVIGLGNREDDDGVYIHLAGPLADRFEILYIDIDFNTWKWEYAIPCQIHPYVLQYLSFKPKALHTQAVDPESMVFATPRSWDRVSQILKFDSDINNPVVRHKIAGNVGEAEAQQFIGFLLDRKNMITADDFLTNKKAPKNPSQIAVLISALVEKLSFLAAVRSADELEKAQRDEAEKLIAAFFELPESEYIVLGLRDAMAVNRGVVKELFLTIDDPAIVKFIRENKYMLE